MLRKVLAFLNDQQRRVKDLDDIRGCQCNLTLTVIESFRMW